MSLSSPFRRRNTREPEASAPVDGPAVNTGFADTPHRTRNARIGRVMLQVLVGLCIVSGAWNLIGHPIARVLFPPAAPPAATEPLDSGAVSRVAVAYTADLFTYDSTAPETTATALARWTGQGTETSPWSGSGTIRPDLVTAGQVVTDGAHRAIVQTSARITDGKARSWVPLSVVVADVDGQLIVASATFSGDAPTVLHRPGDTVDSDLTTATSDAASDLVTAIGTGDLGYVTAPRVQLTGLSGSVELASLSSWTVIEEDGESRYGTATATWQLAGTDLTVRQPIALHITQVEGRWLLDSYGPVLED